MNYTVWTMRYRRYRNNGERICCLGLGVCSPAVTVLMAVACLLIAAPRSSAQSLGQEYIGTSKPFNPTSCKTGDKKYVYWAAKDQVFRFKFDPKEPLYPRGWWVNDTRLSSHWQKEVPPAPMPTEPEGCYGNPLRAGLVPYMSVMADTEYLKLFGPRPTSGKDAYGRIVPTFSRNENGFSANRYLTKSSLYAESSHKNQMIGKDCWQRSPEIWECLIAKGTDRNDYTINRAIKIENILSPEHAGTRDLYVSILHDVPSMVNRSNGLSAQSQISLFEVVLLTTNIRIFPNEIDKLKPYHLWLVRYVLDAHIPGYKWR